jgi:hypothetical protein
MYRIALIITHHAGKHFEKNISDDFNTVNDGANERG